VISSTTRFLFFSDAVVPATIVPPETKYSPRRLRKLVVGTALAIVAIAGANILVLAQSYQSTLHEVENGLLRQSKTLSELVDRSFQSADLVLANVADKVRREAAEDGDLHRLTTQEFYSYLKAEKSELPQIDTLAVLDADGKRLNHSRGWPSPETDLASREYFKALSADPGLASFIGEPVRGVVSGNWVVIIGRPVRANDGHLIGVVSASTHLDYFEALLRATALGDGYAATLLRHDGMLLARFPVAGTIGKVVLASVLKKVADAKSGVSRSISPIDHEPRIAAAYRLSQYPLTVVVTQNERAAFAPWRHTALAMGFVAALIIVLVIIAAYLMARSWKQLDRLSAARTDLVESDKVRALAEVELARQQDVAEQSMRLKVALENMSHGLCMFDGDQRLIVCNQKYADIYGLSKQQARGGTHIQAIFEHQSGIIDLKGDAADYIAGRLADIAAKKVYQLTHRFRDGRLISVTHKPMAGGGWVSTHVDVTEQTAREESFRLLFDSSPVPMWVIDRESLRFLAVNDAAIARYGYSREQFMSMAVPELRPEEDRKRFGNFLRALEPDQFGENIGQHRTADGRIIDVCVYSRALIYAGRNARLAAVHDITNAKRVENELRRTQKFLDAIVEHVPIPIMVKDVSGAHQKTAEYRYSLVNRACEELFGAPRAQIIGKTVVDLFPAERVKFIVAENDDALRADGPVFRSDHDFYTATNGTRTCTATIVAVRDDARNPQYLVTVLQDVTERKRAEDRIARMAHYDQLTNLANRRTFNESMEAAIKRATGCGDQFTVLSLDLDGFKETNDTYGHLVGDALLFEVSRRLMNAADGAFVARVGGDEFALIVDGEAPTAIQLAERILETFDEEVIVESRRIMSGATIGAATYPIHGEDSKTLVSNADIALYRAKAVGRGSILFFDAEMGEQVRERRSLQDALRSAVEQEQLRLHYQPQKTMSGDTIGFEALVRWHNADHGQVPPSVFIPIAEESGLIIPMGEWILREACREAASWTTPLTVAVNVSPLQFRYSDLPALVHAILLETGLAPRRLELEITEGVFIDDFSRAISILSRLKSLGVKIALDDFGSGYSSLSYLHSFAFDKIKIDRTFICDLEHNRHSMAIVHAVIDLGHNLHIPVLAEGVETAAQHTMLRERGCDEVQGYLLGRPLPIENYAALTGSPAIVPSSALLAG
jgi:diguanylate cyclase (GGDEF)-like protein/PAS domain S-box-containing protein